MEKGPASLGACGGSGQPIAFEHAGFGHQGLAKAGLAHASRLRFVSRSLVPAGRFF